MHGNIHSDAVTLMNIKLVMLYVYYLLGRSDITDRTHLIMLVIRDVMVSLKQKCTQYPAIHTN